MKDVINYFGIFLFRWNRPNLMMVLATEEEGGFLLVFFSFWNALSWTPGRALPRLLALCSNNLVAILSWFGVCLSQVQFAVHCQSCHLPNWNLLVERRWLLNVWTNFVFHHLKMWALVLKRLCSFSSLLPVPLKMLQQRGGWISSFPALPFPAVILTPLHTCSDDYPTSSSTGKLISGITQWSQLSFLTCEL